MVSHFHACNSVCGFQSDVIGKVEFDGWINDLLKRTPASWDSDLSPECIVNDYLHELERRVLALGGSLEKHDEATR